MEVNTSQTFINILSKFSFTNLLNDFIIWDGTSLMELSEELVEVDLRLVVPDPLVPVVGRW
jgi:hypothetical protein